MVVSMGMSPHRRVFTGVINWNMGVSRTATVRQDVLNRTCFSGILGHIWIKRGHKVYLPYEKNVQFALLF